GGDQDEDRQDRHGQLDIGDKEAGEADEAQHPRLGQSEDEEQGDDAAEDQGIDLEPAGTQRFDDIELGSQPQLLHLFALASVCWRMSVKSRLPGSGSGTAAKL